MKTGLAKPAACREYEEKEGTKVDCDHCATTTAESVAGLCRPKADSTMLRRIFTALYPAYCRYKIASRFEEVHNRQ